MGNASLAAANEADDGRWDRRFELQYVTGASLLVRAEAVKATGLIRESYFLYWEDADWSLRARRKGYRLLYCPKSRVWHKEGSTSGRLGPGGDYYAVRNGLAFTLRHYPLFLPLVLFSYLAKYTLVRTLKRQPNNLGAVIKGIIDFFGGRKGQR